MLQCETSYCNIFFMLQRHNILNGIWLMDREYANNYLPIIASFIKGESTNVPIVYSEDKDKLTDRNSIKIASPKSDTYQISEYGSAVKPENAPKDSIAIIDINGAITKYDQNCGPAGMQTKSDLLRRCYNNTNIKSVVFRIDSGGGEGYAMRLMNETIGEKNKPVYAFIDDFCCSAAYGIASGCDMVFANSELAKIGSIGTYVTIADFTEAYKKMGVNLIEVYATASKDKNKDFYEAINGNVEPLRKTVNQFNDAFLSTVQTNRNDKLTADQKTWGTGKVWSATEALSLGIIDGISTFENFINEIDSKNITKSQKTTIQMKKQPLKVNEVLNITDLESTEDGVYLNEDQVHTLDEKIVELESSVATITTEKTELENRATTAEAAVTTKDEEIATLTTQVANLKKGAGASTKTGTGKETDANPAAVEKDDFFTNMASARDLVNSIS